MQRKWQRIVGVLVFVVLLYIGSFFFVRKRMSVTFLVHRSYPFHSVNVFYFAQNQTVNQSAYWFYYPIHFSQGASERELLEHMESPENRNGDPPKEHNYYVCDWSRLNRYGLSAFR